MDRPAAMPTNNTEIPARYQPSPLRQGAWLYWPIVPGAVLMELPDEAALRRLIAQEKIAIPLVTPLLGVPASLAVTLFRPGWQALLLGLAVFVAVLIGLGLWQARRLGARRVSRQHWSGALHRMEWHRTSPWKWLYVAVFFSAFALAGLCTLAATWWDPRFQDDWRVWVMIPGVLAFGGLGGMGWRGWSITRRGENRRDG